MTPNDEMTPSEQYDQMMIQAAATVVAAHIALNDAKGRLSDAESAIALAERNLRDAEQEVRGFVGQNIRRRVILASGAAVTVEYHSSTSMPSVTIDVPIRGKQ